MNSAKSPQKNEKVSNKTEPPKGDSKNNDSVNSGAEKTEVSSKSGAPEKKSKSASQLSISHFSSVSTPEYRKGWDKIFGAHTETTEEDVFKTSDVPKLLSLENQDIETDLRQSLDEVFEVIALREGYDFKTLKTIGNLKYKLLCEFESK